MERVGIEGTGSYGAGLSRWLRARGVAVVEVERPKRPARRGRGKSDPIDAEAAARAVQAGTATARPKAGTGAVESIRALHGARRSAVKARTQAANQLHALVVTAPDDLRARLRRLGVVGLVALAAAFRPRALTCPAEATKLALKSIAVRYRRLTAEIEALDAHLGQLVPRTAPDLVAVKGVGADTAADAAGDRRRQPRPPPQRGGLRPPLRGRADPGLLGQDRRHRLNQGGDRQANRALHLLAVRRMGWDPPTQAYVARRTAEGLSKPRSCAASNATSPASSTRCSSALRTRPATLGTGGPRSGPPTTPQTGGAAVTRRAEAQRRAPPQAGLTAAGGGATASPRRPTAGYTPSSSTP